jgi:tetratricopeptide (TPR) repeat protein
MIFPDERLINFRTNLENRVSAGELDEAEAYREALNADPTDPRALRLLALLAEDQGDFAAAEELAWRWLRADPLSHEVFRLIGRLIGRDPAQAARAAAYTELGNQKLHYDPDRENHPSQAASIENEPPEVTREMEPHRLIHTLWTAGADEVDRSLIDAILARGTDIVPWLTGILNLYGEDLLEEVDDALVARTLPLLGEIRSPEALPTLARFLPLEDETLSGLGSWAFQRISFRHPAESAEFIRKQIPNATPLELGTYAQQLSLMPDTPARMDVLRSMETRMPDYTGVERDVIVVAMVISAMIMEGPRSLTAATIERKYGHTLGSESRQQLKATRKELEGEEPLVAEEDEISIYDLCCSAFEPLEEDKPVVRSEPKIGRNDPCWCGSGKKYKKCHLEADLGR